MSNKNKQIENRLAAGRSIPAKAAKRKSFKKFWRTFNQPGTYFVKRRERRSMARELWSMVK